MKRIALTIFTVIQLNLLFVTSTIALGQEWEGQVVRGTLKVVDLFEPSVSATLNCMEGLVTIDRDNNVIPCLARKWRWIDDRTIEFKLRHGVTFHNGEEFDAEAVKTNWEEYKKLESPRVTSFTNLPDETLFKIIDKYTVRFALPGPDGLVFVKFGWFFQAAPAFFAKHTVAEKRWFYLTEAGPWGTGPFEFAQGSLRYQLQSDRIVLEAYEDYWEPNYPKVQKVIFDNTLIGDREKAMKLCRETEGGVDIVSHIRPLDTLKIAESAFAKVIKSRDPAYIMMWFNQRKRDSRWRDIRLRKAVNHAINREELLRYAAKGNAYNLGGGIIPPGTHGHNPDLTPYAYDTGKAKALLGAAGYPDGFGVKLVTSEAFKLEAQILSKMLERVGLKANIDVRPHPEYIRKYLYIPLLEKPPEDQDWDLTCGFVPDLYGHPAASLLGFGYLDESNMRWIDDDPVYESSWREMSEVVDSQEQEKRIRELVKHVHDNAYSAVIYSPVSLYAVNKETNFVPQRSFYLRLKETSVTDEHWSVR